MYLLYNKFSLPIRKLETDCYLPLKISGINGGPDIKQLNEYPDIYLVKIPYKRYISFSDQGIIEFTVSPLTCILSDIIIISAPNLTVIDKLWDKSSLVNLRLSITMALDSNLQEKWQNSEIDYKKINADCVIQIYSNAILILLSNPNEACFLIYENEVLGGLVDKDFNIIGFVSWNIPTQKINEIKNNLIDTRCNVIKTDDFNQINGKICMQDNYELLTNEIFKLDNIDLWQVIYYGLHKFLIDAEFCVKFAERYLTERPKSQNANIVELAGLVDYEYPKTYELIDQIVKHQPSIIAEDEQLYNKLWFYLSLAADMKKLNIIK